MRENTDQKNSEYWYFSRGDNYINPASTSVQVTTRELNHKLFHSDKVSFNYFS